MGIFSFDESETYLEMDNKIKNYEIIFKKIIENCPAGHKYNVFGIETEKVCCYKYHDYCENIKECYLKQIAQL